MNFYAQFEGCPVPLELMTSTANENITADALNALRGLWLDALRPDWDTDIEMGADMMRNLGW